MKGMMMVFRSMRTSEFAATFRACYRSRYFTTESHATMEKKVVHPYSVIHPWRSEDEFAKDLLKNVIYNAGGRIILCLGLIKYLHLPTRSTAIFVIMRLIIVIGSFCEFNNLCFLVCVISTLL